MAQAPSSSSSHPMFINLPAPGSNPDTPEMPGTPTSTTTSLSALSTTAIKDGHRGHFAPGQIERGHQHNPSINSLEAERADRISRLAGLERVSTLRAPPLNLNQNQNQHRASSNSPQTTPTSTTGAPVTFPANYPATQHLTPAYFDSNGQPTAVTKMSTVGSASATESHVGEGSRIAPGDHEEDSFSNYREAGSVTSMGADPDAMDEDVDASATRSVGGYDDRMSDDGSASLVGFGEGAGSTVSGPIYHRRPIPGMTAAQQAHGLPYGPERTNSGLSDARRDRDVTMGGDTPVSAYGRQERRDMRMVDGEPADQQYSSYSADEDTFVDSASTRGAGNQHPGQEAAERILQRLDHGEAGVGDRTIDSPGPGGDKLGKFYFEGGKKEE